MLKLSKEGMKEFAVLVTKKVHKKWNLGVTINISTIAPHSHFQNFYNVWCSAMHHMYMCMDTCEVWEIDTIANQQQMYSNLAVNGWLMTQSSFTALRVHRQLPNSPSLPLLQQRSWHQKLNEPVKYSTIVRNMAHNRAIFEDCHIVLVHQICWFSFCNSVLPTIGVQLSLYVCS